MQNKVRDFYNTRILELESDIKRVKKVLSYFYLARLILFLSLIAFLVLFLKSNNNYLFVTFSFGSLVLFMGAVKLNLKAVYKEKLLTNKLLINENELKYLEHQYHEHDKGDEYNHLNPHLAADFDIFGNGSLYQYLNRCSTRIGKTKFAENLCRSELNEDIIHRKQQAIKELSGKNELIQDFQAYGKLITENGSELSSLQVWLDETDDKIKLLQVLALLYPLISIIWIALIAFGIFSINSAVLLIFLSLFILGMKGKSIKSAHAKLGNSAKTFEKYFNLIKLIEEEDFKSMPLSDLKLRLTNQEAKASQSLNALFKLLSSFDIRYNILGSFILNTLFLFDIQVYCRLSKWKERHKGIVASWFSTLSEIDALISFATFAFNNQDQVSYPRISDKEFTFQVEEIGHPLLNPSVRINNSLHFSGVPSVLIITGANMAGKSTFLRTLSINLMLAMNGAPVCAKDFLFTPCDIMSSIKIQDSLSNNESYFYAELLRIKDIIDHVKAHPKTLVVLDEILRGTNTKDKQLGSLGLLEKLISQNSIVVIATHDLVIGELENKYPDIVTNYCFEVELANDQLIFDYLLKKGISQKLNASFLMKKMGIIGV